MHATRHWIVLAAAFVVGLGHLCVAILRPDVVIQQIGDDALFFVRYAHNLIAGGQYAWNLSEGPVFGATSQLYLLLTTALVAVLPGREAVSVAILPSLMGLVSTGLLMWMSLELTRQVDGQRRGADAAGIGWLSLLFAALLVGFNPKFYQHWFSGMETTMSIAVVTIFLAATRVFSSKTWYLAAFLPMMIVIQFWVRPDLILIAIPTQLMLLASHNRRAKQAAWIGTALSLTGLALSLLAWWLYYGTAVPLPALIKTALSPYSRSAISQYHYGNVAEFLLLIREDSIALLLAGYFFMRRPFTGSRADIGLAAGAALFVVFEMVGNTLPISSGGARFLMPALPMLLWYAIRGFLCALADLDLVSANAARAFGVSAIGATMLVFAPLGSQLAPIIQTLRTGPHRSYVEALTLMAARSGKWQIFPLLLQPGLINCTIADSEVGAIGVISLDRTVYDMSGLNNSTLALRRQDAASYLDAVSPEIMWYRRIDFYWDTGLQRDPRFAEKYRFYDRSAIAVLRTSPCAAALEAVDGGSSSL